MKAWRNLIGPVAVTRDYEETVIAGRASADGARPI